MVACICTRAHERLDVALQPNCYPKIVMVNGVRKVALYSRTAILPEEELTYDYKLPIEFLAEKRVKCLCGKDKCRGFLN
eukprot:scaffold1026_cov409-Prasinococcus_capsulatus_cf.AAC.7